MPSREGAWENISQFSPTENLAEVLSVVPFLIEEII